MRISILSKIWKLLLLQLVIQFIFFSGFFSKCNFCYCWVSLNFRSVHQLGCLQSLLPLHSAVSSARLTSCLGVDSTSSRSLSQGMLCSANPGVWYSPNLLCFVSVSYLFFPLKIECFLLAFKCILFVLFVSKLTCGWD